MDGSGTLVLNLELDGFISSVGACLLLVLHWYWYIGTSPIPSIVPNATPLWMLQSHIQLNAVFPLSICMDSCLVLVQ